MTDTASPVAGIANAFVLTPDIATSGQPAREQFKAIADAGYETVINLALPTSDHALSDEGAVVTALGMTYIHIPVAFDAPRIEEVRRFCGVMETLKSHRTWVHCVVNARVSAFCYLYLRHVRGLDEAACRTPVLERWEPTMTPVWRELLATPADRVWP